MRGTSIRCDVFVTFLYEGRPTQQQQLKPEHFIFIPLFLTPTTTTCICNSTDQQAAAATVLKGVWWHQRLISKFIFFFTNHPLIMNQLEEDGVCVLGSNVYSMFDPGKHPPSPASVHNSYSVIIPASI